MNTPHTHTQTQPPRRKRGASRLLAGVGALLLLGLIAASYLSPDMQAVFAAAWAACL